MFEDLDEINDINFEIYSSKIYDVNNFKNHFKQTSEYKLENDALNLFISGEEIPPITGYTNIERDNYFLINENFQITTPDGLYNKYLTPKLDEHIFSKFLDNSVASFGYFPYLDLIRDQRLRPINSLGFRIAHDINQLVENRQKYKIIVILGGSVAQGVCVNFKDTFCYKLEKFFKQTNQYIHVLNFAMSGQIVTDEFTFIFYCERLSPDLVISFDGFNDLFNSQVSDPYLLNEWNFSYKKT